MRMRLIHIERVPSDRDRALQLLRNNPGLIRTVKKYDPYITMPW